MPQSISAHDVNLWVSRDDESIFKVDRLGSNPIVDVTILTGDSRISVLLSDKQFESLLFAMQSYSNDQALRAQIEQEVYQRLNLNPEVTA
jgi:hypothetical protein